MAPFFPFPPIVQSEMENHESLLWTGSLEAAQKWVICGGGVLDPLCGLVVLSHWEEWTSPDGMAGGPRSNILIICELWGQGVLTAEGWLTWPLRINSWPLTAIDLSPGISRDRFLLPTEWAGERLFLAVSFVLMRSYFILTSEGWTMVTADCLT